MDAIYKLSLKKYKFWVWQNDYAIHYISILFIYINNYLYIHNVIKSEQN